MTFMNRNTQTVLALTVLGVAISGCASIDKSEQEFMDRDDLGRRMVEMESERSDMVASQPLVQDIDTPFLGTSERTLIADRFGLPVHLDTHIELFDVRPYKLSEIAERISQETGIRARVKGKPTDQEMGAQPMLGNSYSNADDALLGTLYAEGSVSPENAIRIDHNGMLSNLLDKVASRFNVAWGYKDNEITFSYSSTRIFQLAALPGSVSQSSTLTNASGGSGGGGDDYVSASGGLSTSYEFSEAVWDSIESSFESILSGAGTYQINPGTSSVVVTARQNAMEEVEAYVDSMNQILGRQVALEVNVYTLQMTEEESKGFSLNAAYNDLASEFGLSLDGLTNDSSTGNQFTASVLGGNSRFDGSELLFNVLNEWGDASIVTSASGVVLNLSLIHISEPTRPY